MDYRDLLDILKTGLKITHDFELDNQGKKYLNINIDLNGWPLSTTSILIGQEKDLHDYSTDFKPQIMTY